MAGLGLLLLLPCHCHCRLGATVAHVVLCYFSVGCGSIWLPFLVAPGHQAALEKALGPFDAPAVLAVTAEKKLFTIHYGALTEDAVSKFCDKLMTGRAADTKDLSAIPAIATSEPWDGKNGKVVVEEEFSLEDVMGEL